MGYLNSLKRMFEIGWPNAERILCEKESTMKPVLLCAALSFVVWTARHERRNRCRAGLRRYRRTPRP